MKKLIIPILVFALACTTTVKAQSSPEYTQVTVDELPGAVRDAVNNNYRNWTIVTAYRVTEITGQTGTRGNNSGAGNSQNNSYNDNTMSGTTGNRGAGKANVEKVQTNNRNDNRPDNPSYESQNGTARTTITQETPEPDNTDTFDNQDPDDTENEYDPFEEDADNEDTFDNEGTMETAPAQTNDNSQINYDDTAAGSGGNAGKERVYYELILTGDNETQTVKFDENGNEI